MGNIIHGKKTWEKLLLAARAIAAVENPQDVFVFASRPYAQRAVLKFARYVGCSSIAGRFTPGAFTNQIQSAFREPRLLLITDPRVDHQPVTEGSYANVPIVAFANVDSPTKFIDMGMPDLFFYRDPEEIEKEERERAEAAAESQNIAKSADFVAPTKEEWGADEAVTDWAADGQAAAPAAPAPAAIAVPAAAPAATFQVTEDWAAQTETSDWAAASAAPAEQAAPANTWGGSSQW